MKPWIACLLLAGALPAPALDLATLTEGKSVEGFTCHALYEDGSGRVMGARLQAPNGFVLDLLTIESVPQAFWWIRTTPDGSRGEPHACEHLLLGKGRRGRAVAALEDMRLATSTAYTDQLHTCYQFHTTAGLPTFLELFEAKLRALLQPDFLDEEIRREVCHYDVAADDSGRLSLEEKGTVYTEMVSSFEKPWYWGSEAMARLVYGEGHPLYNNAGGDPRVMWEMEPGDLWHFHRHSHFPANMGAIVSLPSSANLDSTLAVLRGILERCDAPAPRAVTAGIGTEPLPAPRPAATGTRVRAAYPSPRPEDPASLSLQWPADLELTPLDTKLLDLFLSAFAGGETSTLYDRLIDSGKRELDLGASSVWGYQERRLGHSIVMGVGGLRPDGLDSLAVDQVLAVIQGSLRELAACAPGDSQLTAFNDRLAAIAVREQRQLRDYLGSPPMFGHRSGNAGTWLRLLEQCEQDTGFRHSLVRAGEYRAVDSLLALPGNPWTAAITRWHLLERAPFIVVSTPSPELQQQVLQDRTQRRDAFITDLKKRLKLDDEQAALAVYRDEFAARTVELERASADDPLPGFLPDPPLGLDDELDYTWEWPLFTASFPSMESATLGVALDLRQWPNHQLALIPLLTESLCEVGLVLGDTLAYPEMQQALRREILGLSCHVGHSDDGKRLELVVEARGGTRAENRRALDWLKAVLEQPLYTEAALPRLRDRVAQRITELRNMPQWPEEYWVNDPAFAWRFQDDPALQAADGFLTRIQLLERAAWMLRDPGTGTLAGQHKQLFEELARRADSNDSGLREVLQEITQGGSGGLSILEGEVAAELRDTSTELARALLRCSADLPPLNHGPLLARLCRTWQADLLQPPAGILENLRDGLATLRTSGSTRAWLVGNPADVAELAPGVKSLCNTPAGAESRMPAVSVPSTPESLVFRLQARSRMKHGVAGLVHTDTRNGTVIFSARVSEPWSTRREDLLRCLAGKLYGGGGAHGFFMQTWAAGLAYSNGYRYRESQGRVSYYAERCPDVGATLEFVSRTLKEDAGPKHLADYAVAQVFGPSRAADPYEDRARGMARDLVDSNEPARISAFRQAVQDLRAEPDLEDTLRAHLTAAHEPVLIGVGKSLKQSEDGSYFVIGPEEQFQSLEKALKDADEPQTVLRLYPCDFWLWNTVDPNLPADRQIKPLRLHFSPAQGANTIEMDTK